MVTGHYGRGGGGGGGDWAVCDEFHGQVAYIILFIIAYKVLCQQSLAICNTCTSGNISLCNLYNRFDLLAISFLFMANCLFYGQPVLACTGCARHN